MPTTKTQIDALISQITTGGNYTATELRALQNALVENVFGPFYDNANRNPVSSQNQSLGFKQNSLGVNRANGRYFVCSASSSTSATWEQISLDKEFFSINASNNQTYTIPNNASTVLYGGLQGNVTVNLPTAANSYPGKKVKVFFTSPASNTGTGITFYVPETVGPYSPNSLPANVYTSNSVIEFVFNGSVWVICQFVPTAQDIGYQVVTASEGGTQALSQDTAIALIEGIRGGATSFTAFNILMPPNPYAGKVVKIATATSTSLTNITTLTIKTSSGGTIAGGASSGTISSNQAIEYVYNGSIWVRVAPTTNIWMP